MLPKTISGRYELYKQEELCGQNSAEKGLYIDKKTNTVVFIKVSSHSKLLFREYMCQRLFYEQSNKLKNTDIIISKPLEILKGDNYAALIMEYFSAESLLKADVKTRLDAYTKTLKFLEKINTKTDAIKKCGLTRKSAMQQFITLPYFLSKNLILYPTYTSLFLRSAGLIIRFMPKWTKLASNWICHGDINVTNVLYLGQKVIILDFANTCMSHYYFDMSRALNSTWYHAEFHEQFWNHLVSEFRFAIRQQNILKSFVVFNLMQRLSQRCANPDQERFYLKRLGIILSSL